MTKNEALDDILQCIGSLTYGKERWFDNNGVWYDRATCEYVTTEEMVLRVCKELNESIEAM